MSLSSGTKLGPYEITGTLGTGGMGEVYRARDTKLNREVAIKVLPPALAGDPAAFGRFQREAQAVAALSHPNILAIFDFGVEGGTPYAVMELLEGQSLRGALQDGALPVRKALDYALQIAAGLAAAHARGITHRDLKPENVFVTRDGQIKILDFGLAKVSEPSSLGQGATLAATMSITTPGSVLGTVGYMAPEQIRGQAVDARADIFALGVILYELLSGQRAFSGPSAVETLNAILKEDPPELTHANPALPPALDRIVHRCLEKNPDERFQSARDLAFALDAISGSGSGAMVPIAAPVQVDRWSIRKCMLAGIAALVLLTAGWALHLFLSPRPAALSSLRLTRLTFDRGCIQTARFSPDGKTVIYDAEWNGLPPRIFQTRLGNPESNPLPLPNANLAAISPNQEMVITLDPKRVGWTLEGTLAQAPLVGGTPKTIQEGIRAADWSPLDGSQLAIARRVQGRDRLEYPRGQALKETETTGYISHPRVSPQGDAIAYLEHPVFGDNRGHVALVPLNGNKKILTEEWSVVEGLAWSPDGKEVWFTASRTGSASILHGVTRNGAMRDIWSDTTNLVIQDTFRDGRALIATSAIRCDIYWLGPGEARERNVSWFSWSTLSSVSADGRMLLLGRYDEGAGLYYGVGLRRINEPTSVWLGQGAPMHLSPDNRWALAIVHSEPNQIKLLATGTDESRNLTTPGFKYFTAGWFPDGKRILLFAEEGSHASYYIQDLAGGRPQRILENIARFDFERGLFVSPDAKYFTGGQTEGPPVLLPVAGGEPRSLPGLAEGDIPVGWNEDGRGLYINRSGIDRFGTIIAKYDLDTGHIANIREIRLSDLAGMSQRPYCRITPDGRTVTYGAFRILGDLFLVEGLR
jgi:serine/threonine protein kinase/Tol biopolymer transport system component